LQGTKQEWRLVFYLSAALFLLGGIFFAIFAEGTVQPWAKTSSSTSDVRVANGEMTALKGEEVRNEDQEMSEMMNEKKRSI